MRERGNFLWLAQGHKNERRSTVRLPKTHLIELKQYHASHSYATTSPVLAVFGIFSTHTHSVVFHNLTSFSILLILYQSTMILSNKGKQYPNIDYAYKNNRHNKTIYRVQKTRYIVITCLDSFYPIALNASSSAAIKSLTFSVPIDKRMVLGLIPWFSSSSSVSCECVVLAG